MKANLSLYNAISNIWMCAIHPSRQISVTSVDWWTFNCQLFSCLALKTMPFCCEIIVTLFPSSEVHTSMRCIKSDVALTFINNCRRKTLDFLRLFRGGYFKESGVKLWPILPDAKNTNESFHRKCGQRQDLHFNLICRLSHKPWRALLCCLFAQITNLTIWGLALPHIFQMKAICSFEASDSKGSSGFDPSYLRANSHFWVEIYRLNQIKFVFKWLMFPNWTLLPSFSVKNAIIPGTQFATVQKTQRTKPTRNGFLSMEHTKNLYQPKMVVANWMQSHRVVW